MGKYDLVAFYPHSSHLVMTTLTAHCQIIHFATVSHPTMPRTRSGRESNNIDDAPPAKRPRRQRASDPPQQSPRRVFNHLLSELDNVLYCRRSVFESALQHKYLCLHRWLEHKDNLDPGSFEFVIWSFFDSPQPWFIKGNSQVHRPSLFDSLRHPRPEFRDLKDHEIEIMLRGDVLQWGCRVWIGKFLPPELYENIMKFLEKDENLVPGLFAGKRSA